MKRLFDVCAVLIVPGTCLLLGVNYLRTQAATDAAAAKPIPSRSVICPLTGEPLGADEICSLVAPSVPSVTEDDSEETVGPRMTKLTPEEIKARVYAVDPTNRFAYPGRPYVIGESEWVLDNSVIDESGMQRRVRRTTGRNHRSNGKLSDRFSDVVLKNEGGQTVRFYSDLVKDQVVLVTFFYTRCSGICAPTNENIVELRKLLAKSIGPDVRFISISLDSDYDKPAVLKAFAEHYKIDDAKSELPLPRWDFVCGNWDEINILRKEMGVYDLDPVIDSDRSQHAGIMTFGNDRTDRWSAIASLLPPETIQTSVMKFAGSRYKDPQYAVKPIISDERWEIRGPLTGLRPWNHGLSVLGSEQQIPDRLEIQGTTGIHGEMLKELVDSSVHQGLRVLMPYPRQTAALVSASGGYDADGNRVADHLRVDPGTHLLAGTLRVSGDEQLTIAGVSVIENPDLRFPMLITNLAGEELSLDRMPACLGRSASARGYFLDGAFYAIHLQVDDLPRREHIEEGSAIQVQMAVSDRTSGILRIAGSTGPCPSSESARIEVLDGMDSQPIGTGVVTSEAGGPGNFIVQLCALKRVPSFVVLKWHDGTQYRLSDRRVVQPASLNELPGPAEAFVQGPLENISEDLSTLTVGSLPVQVSKPSLLLPDHVRNALGTQITAGSDSRSILASEMNSGIPLRADFRELSGDASEKTIVPEATVVRLLPEECLVSGSIEGINEQDKTATIAGVNVRLTGDPRFPLSMESEDGNPVEIPSPDQWKTLQGKHVTVHGLSHVWQERQSSGMMMTKSSVIAVRIQVPAEQRPSDASEATSAE